jgi:hypothetical protein
MTILEQLESKHKRTGGNCGTYLQDFEGILSETKKELNRLLKRGIVRSVEGIHGKMAMLTDSHAEFKKL